MGMKGSGKGRIFSSGHGEVLLGWEGTSQEILVHRWEGYTGGSGLQVGGIYRYVTWLVTLLICTSHNDS